MVTISGHTIHVFWSTSTHAQGVLESSPISLTAPGSVIMALPLNKGKTLNLFIPSISLACLFNRNPQPGAHTNPLCALLGGCWLIALTRKYSSKAIISVIWLLFQFCSLRSISTHEAPHWGITKSAQENAMENNKMGCRMLSWKGNFLQMLQSMFSHYYVSYRLELTI